MDLKTLKENLIIEDFLDVNDKIHWVLVEWKNPIDFDNGLSFDKNQVCFTLNDDFSVWRQDDGSAAQETEEAFLEYLYQNDIDKDEFFDFLDAEIKKTACYENYNGKLGHPFS